MDTAGVTQDITQRRFGHLIQSNIKIGSNPLHAFIDLLLAVTSEDICCGNHSPQMWYPA